MSTLISKRIGLRAKLMAGAAVLLAFAAILGVLGMRDMSTAASQADALYTAAAAGHLDQAKAAHDPIQAHASAARTRVILGIALSLVVGFGMAFFFSRRIMGTV